MSQRHTNLRLGAYLFLQYFMLGVWFVALGTYMSKALRFDGVIGLAYAAQGLAAMIASPFIGALADRYIPARKLLAMLMMISALTLFALTQVSANATLFLFLVLVHFLAFVPTIPLSNAVCLNALAAPESEFARIRTLGTLGWIAGGLLIGSIPNGVLTPLPMAMAGAVGLLLAGGSMLLPDLPATGGRAPTSFAGATGLDVIGKIRDRSFWAVCICAVLLSIPLAFYNAYCNNFLQEAGATLTIMGKTFEPTAIQALGQMSELFFLLTLPITLRLIGIGGVLVVGMIAWILRACLFMGGFSGAGDPATSLLVGGILLHGLCYDFILIGAALFVDQSFNSSARSRAQSFLTMITMGAGILAGSVIANTIYDFATVSANVHDWRFIWSVVAGVALLALLVFVALFRDWSGQNAIARNPKRKILGVQQ